MHTEMHTNTRLRTRTHTRTHTHTHTRTHTRTRTKQHRYFALCGIAILLLIVRVLRRMDFQPNLGVVTRSLWLAGSDLIHFAVVFFMVFIIYSLLAHLAFGHTIEKFSTFDASVSTCFEVCVYVCISAPVNVRACVCMDVYV